MGRSLRLLFLVLMLMGSLGAAGIGMGPVQAGDPRDGDPREWERQVAADARGDVLIDWPGTIDLYYMTVGELYSLGLGETYLLIRIGYNITENGDETAVLPEDSVPVPGAGAVPFPDVTPDQTLTTINVTFNVSRERDVRISLYSMDRGDTWVSNEGRLLADNGPVDGHREVIYITPYRRFELEPGDIIGDHNVSAYRSQRLTDTMQGFEPIHDISPVYFRVHPLLDRLQSDQPLPLPEPIPPRPQPPVPPPEPPVDPKEVVPDDPWQYPPDAGDHGIPEGIPTGDDVDEEDPLAPRDRDDGPTPVDPEKAAGDPDSGRATQQAHKLTDGRGRFVARGHQEYYTAGFNHVAWANFTLESRFKETDQQVLMLGAGLDGHRWLFRYGLDMPLGVKTLPADGKVDMSIIGAPNSLFASAQVPATAIFISDWGGIDLVPVTFLNTNFPDPRGTDIGTPTLPTRLRVDIVNEDDPFRVNEPRKIMVRVRDGDFNYESRFTAVRAFIYPAGTPQPAQPYELKQKFFTPGIYEIDMVFDRPGAWIIDVYFFDYQPNTRGTYPHIDFQVRVEYEGKTQPIIPVPAALGSLGLLMLALVARERMAKSR